MGQRKRTKAGHDGLGAELRRLRGGRTLDQISELSKAEPFAGRIKPIAAPTLSLIENGISMPNLETLYTLSILYKTPMQRLWEIVGLERMIAATPVPRTFEETERAWDDAWKASRWHDALALTVHAETLLTDPEDAVKWRASRGTCLARIGMPAEGVAVLLDCLESPHVSASQRHYLHHDLAVVHAAAGQPRAAVRAMRDALGALPEDATAERTWHVRLGLAGSLLAVAQHGLTGPGYDVGEALRWIGRALQDESVAASPLRIYWELYEGIARRFEGNHAMAEKLLAEVARRADPSVPEAAFSAVLHLGAMRRENGRLDAAGRALERAEAVADRLDDPQLKFDVAVELLLLARARGEAAAAERFRRRCDRHFPFVPSRSPSVLAFERLAAEEAG